MDLIKNKKGQQIFVSIMIGIIVFILIIILSFPLKDEIAKAKNTTYLNESNLAGLTVENQATVIILDMIPFYFIGTLIAISIAFVTGKKNITGVITAIMVFIIISILITPLKSLIILARDADHLDCTNTAITTGGKLACIVVDIWLFYFVVAAIAASVTYIFLNKALPRMTGEA